MKKIKDFSSWVECNDMAEGSGRSEKIWLEEVKSGSKGLFKFKKAENTTDHISEQLAYQIAELLDIPCAKFEIGSYKGRMGSMSYEMTGTSQLVEGINYISTKYPEFDPDHLVDKVSKRVYSIEMIKEVLDGVIEFKEFLKVPVFDYLIGNSDRHQSNWGILISDGNKVLSPLYDNSSSLCAYLSEKQVNGYLGNDFVHWRSLIDTKSKSIIRRTYCEKNRPTHLQMMSYIKENYYSETYELVKKVVDRVTTDWICGILNEYVETELSETRKKVILQFLVSKVANINKLYFGEEE